MKFLLIVCGLMMLFYGSYAQNSTTAYQAFKSDAAKPDDIGLQNSYVFKPITEAELFNRSFFIKSNRETGYTFRNGFEAPGYYRPGEMMSTENMYSSVGKLKFHCNYYFDADGQLQDGDITISKLK